MHRQMYYTSCERGLSGYAGFQFNAATPGTPDEEFRRVEALTVYEPPQTIGHAPTAAQIAATPVNLCFDPGDQPIVANVRFVGADYSGRFGNYFAHALLGAGPFGLLPIELWGSPLWSARESPTTELPGAPEPLKQGPLSRAAVERFLTSSGGRRRLPALMTAAALAVVSGERSIVLYAQDSDRVAHWIAAVSYLLPPGMVRRMSFATYRYQPGMSRQHIIGTVPGSDFEPSPAAFESFYLFDFVNGAASDVPEHPLAAALAGVGMVQAGALWRAAENLADGTEQDLDAWRPVVLAAQVLIGDGLAAPDVAPVLDWLETAAARLPPASVEQICRAAGADTPGLRELRRLAAIAAAAGLGHLGEELEIKLATLQISGHGATADPLRTAGGRRHAGALYAQRLGTADADELARLILLAGHHGVRIDPALLSGRAYEVFGPLLFRTVPEPMRQVMKTEAPVRQGVFDYLEKQSFARQLEAFTGLDGIFEEEDLAARRGLRKAALIASARNGGADKVTTVLRVADRGIEDWLLKAVWPAGPELSEAVALLREAGRIRLPAGWIEELALRRPAAGEPTADLFRYLAVAQVDGRLGERAVQRIKRMTWALDKERDFARTRHDNDRERIAIALIRAYHDQKDVLDGYLPLVLPDLLLELPPENAYEALSRTTSDLRGRYLARVTKALAEPRPEAFATAAEVFVIAWLAEHKGQGGMSEQIEKRLLETLGNWGQRDLKKVGKAVKKHGDRFAETFELWCETNFRRRLLPRWMTRN